MPTPPERARELERLRAEARYARDRLALYRRKAYSGRDTSGSRLRELERASALADERLQDATGT